ncbi:MAG: hypothetical protein KF764_07225 [Labilithrix sp.]|nr:hypothetical protein [Labilithrix sp.]MBX3220226.1 hypothetical protein [Labilithrix sp.]
MKTFTTLAAAAFAMLVLAAPASAAESASDAKRVAAGPAAEEAPAASRFHFDLETDPTAFVFRGYSLHAGLGWKHLRLDVGAYAMDLPGFVESNEGFASSFHGAGAKLQLFLFDEQKGGFVGIDGGINHLRTDLEGTGRHASQDQISVGVNFGWRFALPFDLYATPWLGVSYSPNVRDMEVAGKTYRANAMMVFPAVHLGYRFM